MPSLSLPYHKSAHFCRHYVTPTCPYGFLILFYFPYDVPTIFFQSRSLLCACLKRKNKSLHYQVVGHPGFEQKNENHLLFDFALKFTWTEEEHESITKGNRIIIQKLETKKGKGIKNEAFKLGIDLPTLSDEASLLAQYGLSLSVITTIINL